MCLTPDGYKNLQYVAVSCHKRHAVSSGSLLVVVSLVTIAAITVDRYLAFVLHLRYATTITVSRVIKLICYFLVLSSMFVLLLVFYHRLVWKGIHLFWLRFRYFWNR